MTKDDVRKNAARLIRDDAAQRRVLATVNAQPLQNTALNSTTNQVRIYQKVLEKKVNFLKAKLRAL